MTERRIIIVGFMGSGKSTVARALADQLSSNMIDLDEEITRIAGRAPQRIITEDGENVFRKIETDVLTKILADDAASVIALGGGAWIMTLTRQLIERDGAVTVWLDAPFDLCWQRIRSSEISRPLASSETQARRLYDERRPTYKLAGIRVGLTRTKSADQIAKEIVEALKNFSE